MLGITGSELAVLEQKDRWAVELRDLIVRIVKTANPRRLVLFGSKPGTVLYPALKEGIIVYEA